jgi:putative spermidine/putrescine transport system substrate-binding protein
MKRYQVLTRREMLKLGGVTAGALALGSLIPGRAQAKTLNTIALPPDWANYGEIMAAFTQKYGITINNASPNASSAEELQALRSLKGQSRAPDVVDVGPSFAIQGKQEGLFAPYKVSTWDSIPANMKDPEGYWYGDYFGVISFGVNTSVVKKVPKTWADLKDPVYKGQVALNGSPVTAGAAFAGVWSAALANGGSLDDITPGIEFFAELKKMGNYIPVNATPATVQTGQTPIVADWDYLNLGYSKEFAGKLEWKVGIPDDGVYGSYYCQAISASAPNPASARQWMEFLYSDEGQLLFLKGYAHPVRFNDLVRRKVIPAELLAKLPPSDPYAKVRFATQSQLKKAQETLKAQWAAKVG